MEISVSKLRQRNLLEIMRLFYCMDKDRFVSAFSTLGIPIMSEADLEELAKIHENRWDVDGKLALKDEQGEPLKFDIREFVNYNIPLRNSQIVKCSVKFIK